MFNGLRLRRDVKRSALLAIKKGEYANNRKGSSI